MSRNPRTPDLPPSAADRAGDDAAVLAFGHLVGAANRLGYILGRALEQEFQISHQTFEVLVILAQADADGLSMRSIGQEQVLSTGGVTRLIDRMEAAGLVARHADPDDRRGRRVRLTPAGERLTARASHSHAENVRRYFLGPVAPQERDAFIATLKTLSHAARDELPRLP
ncbi:MAG: MarR family winged helix-turn-helix transcriptional regulator [Solirubrobacteraceae bacterium]|jgi:DNA-binding MarR family transcriptional regulator